VSSSREMPMRCINKQDGKIIRKEGDKGTEVSEK
jgi:hypothetical protein